MNIQAEADTSAQTAEDTLNGDAPEITPDTTTTDLSDSRRGAADVRSYEEELRAALSADPTTPPTEETEPEATAPEEQIPEEVPSTDAEATEEGPERVRLTGLSAVEKTLIAAAKAMAVEQKIPFQEAFNRLNAATAPEQPAAESTTKPEATAPGRTVEAIQAEIARHKAEKRTFAENLDTVAMLEADDAIDALREELTAVKQAEQAQAQTADVQFQQEIEKFKVQTVERYPDAAKPNSALARKMEEIANQLEADGNDLIYHPNAAFKVAQMAANELGIAPKAATAKPSSQPPTPATPTRPQAVRQSAVAGRQPAITLPSGAGRTTQMAPGPDPVGKIQTAHDYERELRSLGVSL